MAWIPKTTTTLNGLWCAVYKVNSDAGGFNFKIWMADKDEIGARAIGEDIGGRIKQLLPQDAEIYLATAYCMDANRNGMALRDCLGQGNWGNLVVSPATPTVTSCDNSHSAIKIRLEDIDLGVVSRKFNLIPDDVSAKDDLINHANDVVGIPVALPASPVAADTYAQQMNKFMQALVFSTVHVQKGYVPGGAYNYKTLKNCYLRGLTTKKGGRVFTS